MRIKFFSILILTPSIYLEQIRNSEAVSIKQIILHRMDIASNGQHLFCIKNKLKRFHLITYFFRILEICLRKRSSRIFLLGGKTKELEAATKNLINHSFKLNIVGQNNGYFDKQNESEEVILKINSVQPDVLLVGIGITESVEWIIKNKERINSKLIFTVGNLFDIIGEGKKIAPKFLYNTPFEWIYRLLQEPFKLFKRYLICHSYFFYRVIKEKIGF